MSIKPSDLDAKISSAASALRGLIDTLPPEVKPLMFSEPASPGGDRRSATPTGWDYDWSDKGSDPAPWADWSDKSEIR